LTLSIEAGVSLCEVQKTLAQHGQFLPLAVPFMNRTTAGGTIASGVDSPLRQSYGTARDYILGLEFVTGEGIAAKSGGRVVKNVTGYDIHKLLAGSLGTLGVITKINLRTFPRPSNMRGFVATFETHDGAVALRHRIAKSPLSLLTLEIFSPKTGELFSGDSAARVESNPIAVNLFSNRHWTLAVQFAGNDNVIARCERELREMAELCGANNAQIVAEGKVSSVFGRAREFVPITLESSAATTIVKMSVQPSRMADMIGVAAKAADEVALPWAALARGVGVIYFALLSAERSEQTLKNVAQATSKMLAGCTSSQGNAMIPWCPTEWKPALNIWGPNRGDFDLMRKLKKLFDPGDVLSPGRFAGGI
jgi:glycolate oxidase FAD binding subunit